MNFDQEFAKSISKRKKARFRKNLKFLRSIAWSQGDLAMAIGCGENTLSKWECGFQFPTEHFFNQIARALKVTKKDLLEKDLVITQHFSKRDLERFGKNFKYLRIKLGTQDYLMQKLRILRKAIYNYENGLRLPRPDILLDIARVFKVSPKDLIFKDLTPKQR